MKDQYFGAKDLLGLRGIKKEQIEHILREAANLKPIILSPAKHSSYLKGKTCVMLFYENSTRTRLSFEMAAKYLGAASASVSASGSSINKGENLYDTARTIEQMGADIIVMRHPHSGAPHFLASRVGCSVLNAGDGMNEHPTQALLDMLTVREYKGGLEGLKVAIVGDLEHSRVLRSNMWGMSTMGAKVYVYGPPTMIPRDLEKTSLKVCASLKEALSGADVVMGLRVQRERQDSALFPCVNEYAKYFGINSENLSYAKSDALIMHPGPCNRGVEMTSEIHDHERSVIEEQVTNGVAVRMALLRLFGHYHHLHMMERIQNKERAFAAGKDRI